MFGFSLLKKAIKLLILVLVIVVILAWAPWLNDQETREHYVTRAQSSLSATSDVINVQWIPFGRLATPTESYLTQSNFPRFCAMTFWKSFYCL